MVSQIWVLVASLSIVFNFIIIGILFLTGIGKEVWTRFWNRIRHNKGGYVNSLFIDKDGNIKEVFKKVDEKGMFSVADNSYGRSPRCLLNYKKIPTYIHMENKPEPINPYVGFNPEDAESIAMASAGEIDNAIITSQKMDAMSFLKKLLPLAIILIGVVAFVAAAGIYFNWQIYDIVVQQGQQVVSDAVSNGVGDAVSNGVGDPVSDVVANSSGVVEVESN